jgi:hypothetical protein
MPTPRFSPACWKDTTRTLLVRWGGRSGFWNKAQLRFWRRTPRTPPIAEGKDLVLMASAMKHAVIAGREAFDGNHASPWRELRDLTFVEPVITAR